MRRRELENEQARRRELADQLDARRVALEAEQVQLDKDRATLEAELGPRPNMGGARFHVCQVQADITVDADGLPCFE